MVISRDGKTEFLQKLDNEKVTNTDTAQQQTADKLPKNATKKTNAPTIIPTEHG